MASMFNISYKRVGGMSFLKVGNLSLSWCITSGNAQRKAKLSRKALAKHAYWRGYDRAVARWQGYRVATEVIHARKVVESTIQLRQLAGY